jgi:uncharacterized protein YutE (UPF0331/DUF86 family)
VTQTELESTKLEQIASEYRRKGYEVVVRPLAPDLPRFLAHFQPDLIARSQRDSVVVEVKSSPDLVSDAIVAMAEAVEAQPAWRFEIAVVNPPMPEELPADGELVPHARAQVLLRQAMDLSREKRYEAAAIVAWSAAEAIFRRLARANGVESERKSSGTVLKQLYALGLISADQYETFERTMRFRNAFAHGYAAKVTPGLIEQFIRDVEDLRSSDA